MDTLAYMAGDPPANVSSRAIKDALGWQDGRFANVRRGLVDAGLITRGSLTMPLSIASIKLKSDKRGTRWARRLTLDTAGGKEDH